MQHILLIGADNGANEQNRDALVSEGHQADIAASVTEGLTALDAGRYGCVVADIGLSGGDEFSLCKTIREKARDAALILLGGPAVGIGDDSGYFTRLYNAGCDMSLPKPYTPKELCARAHIAMRRRWGEHL